MRSACSLGVYVCFMLATHPFPAIPGAHGKRPAIPVDPPPPRAVLNAAHYGSQHGSRSRLAIALLISAGLHAGMILGLGHRERPAAPRADDNGITINITMPQIKDLEEPETFADDGDAKPREDSAYVPMQMDAPVLALPTDFVQQLDFSTLLEKPDLTQAKVFAIPDAVRRGGKISDKLGIIFNLADLDRTPEPLFQPKPIYPIALKREAWTATVHVEFIVDAQGSARNAMVVESTHHGFDAAAVTGVSKWKFRPGIKSGRKVNTRMRVPIIFKVVDEIN